MTNLQQLQEEETKNLKKIAEDIKQLILERSFNNRMGLSVIKEDVAINNLSDLFNRNLDNLIQKAYQLGQQDMLERVREIISDKIDGLRINNSSIFEHGDYYKKEDILKALDNLKKQI